MDEIIIRYWSPHGRQEEKKFHCQEQKIDLTTRAAKRIDLSSLERCNRLVTLNLSNNMIEQLDLRPIKDNQTLSEIRLENNHLPSLAKIVEVRKHEIEKTTVPTKGSTSIMNSLWLTHYGYKILEALGVGLQHFGTGIETVKSSFKDLGFSLRTREVESLDKVEISESVTASISLRKYVYNEIEKAYY